MISDAVSSVSKSFRRSKKTQNLRQDDPITTKNVETKKVAVLGTVDYINNEQFKDLFTYNSLPDDLFEYFCSQSSSNQVRCVQTDISVRKEILHMIPTSLQNLKPHLLIFVVNLSKKCYEATEQIAIGD